MKNCPNLENGKKFNCPLSAVILALRTDSCSLKMDGRYPSKDDIISLFKRKIKRQKKNYNITNILISNKSVAFTDTDTSP